ncbi:MAG TPA: hypothetical protein PK185_01160 [Cyclobacteriaceae bacterium]|nr:hypothetical protein [Cyclobacteriaceae bacterium]
MKLSKHQYQDILQVLTELNIPPENLSLVKRKGRIRVIISGIDSYFEFFKRKSIAITRDGLQWKDVAHYELNISGIHKNVPAWIEVILEFRIWIKGSEKAS